MPATYFAWALVYNLPALGMAVAGSLLARGAGLPRRARAAGSLLLALGLARLAAYAACDFIRIWYKSRPGVVQADWEGALDLLSHAQPALEALAVVALVVALAAGRGPEGSR